MDGRYLMFDRDEVSVTGFSTSSRGKKSIVTVKLEVASPWALGDLLRDLQAFHNAPATRKPGGVDG